MRSSWIDKTLERRTGIPLHLQVERRIEDSLFQGRYKAGYRIPPEAELTLLPGYLDLHVVRELIEVRNLS